MSKKTLFSLGGAAALMACLAFAQSPVVNIPRRHGNLRDAQNFIVQAYQKIDSAQIDNRGHMGGHAARAKELLREADNELRRAADELR